MSAETAAVIQPTSKNDVTHVTHVTALKGKGKTGYTPDVTACNPCNQPDSDPLAAAIEPAEVPPSDDIVTVEPPTLDQCPCWRVYLDWWVTGKRKRRPGVWYHHLHETGDGTRARIDDWICGPLVVEATTFDHRGESFGRLLRFRDVRHQWHEWNMPMRLLRGDCIDLRGELLDLGLEIDPKNKTRLPFYLSAFAPKRHVLSALTLGWHEGSFVLPDQVIGEGDMCYQSEIAAPPDFAIAGTLAGWRDTVAAAAVGNRNLTLTISTAFAGPLMDLVNVEHAGLHLYGDSSAGKTTAVQAAVSVWGGQALLRTWRATANGLEAAAAESNDTLLALDEIGQARGSDIGAIIYLIANGQGKGRANVKGGSRRRQSWRTVLLSSGERTIEAHMAADGARYHAGQEVRLINLSAGQRQFGAFDNIHGAVDGRAFADSIKRGTKRHHGRAGPEFVKWLVKNAGEDFGAQVQRLADLMPAEQGQEARVSHQLALIGAAGELATGAGITGWPAGMAAQASIDAYAHWKSERGAGAAEDHQILEAIRDFIDRHGGARFSDRHDTAAPPIRDRAGYTEVGQDGETAYLFHAGGLREAIRGHDLKRALLALAAACWIPEPKSTVVKVGGKPTRLYRVTLPDAIEDEGTP